MFSLWRRQVLIVCVGSALLLLAPATVHGEDVGAIIKKGTDLRRKGRDAEALTEFRRAAEIEASPRVMAQIALAEQALGLWLDANAHLGQALEQPRDPWIVKNRKALDSAHSTIQAHLSRLEVWGSPDGAEVFLDGKRVGTLPSTTVWVAAGGVSVEVKALGYGDGIRTLLVPEGGRIREHFQLRPAPLPTVVSSDTGSEGTSTLKLQSSDNGGATSSDRGAETTTAHGHHHWLLWTLVGVGVLAAGGAGAWFLTHRQEPCDPANCSRF